MTTGAKLNYLPDTMRSRYKPVTAPITSRFGSVAVETHKQNPYLHHVFYKFFEQHTL